MTEDSRHRSFIEQIPPVGRPYLKTAASFVNDVDAKIELGTFVFNRLRLNVEVGEME